MPDFAKIAVELSLQNQAYLKGIQESLNETKKFAAESTRALTSLQKAGQALTGLITTAVIAKAVEFMIESAEKVDDAQRRINITLTSTQGIAGVSAQAINKYTEELSNMSVYGKAALLETSNELLRYTNIHKNEFKGALKATVDLASGLKMDLPAAANIVGRALENPANAARALRQAHITLSDTQQKTITQFMALGKVAESQTIIMQEFNKTYGGQAAAELDDFNGQLTKLKVNIAGMAALPGDVLSHWGKDLLSFVNKGLEKLKEFNEKAAAYRQFIDDIAEDARMRADPNLFIVHTPTAPEVQKTPGPYKIPASKAADAYAKEQAAALRKLDEYLARHEADSLDRRLAVAQLHYQESSEIAQKYITDEKKKEETLSKLDEEYQNEKLTAERKYYAEKVLMGVGFAKDAMQLANAINQFEQQKAQEKLKRLDQQEQIYSQFSEAQKKQEIEAVEASADTEEEKKKKIDAINKKYGQQEYTVQLAIAFMRYQLQKAAFEQQQKFQEAQIWVQAAAGAVGAVAQSLIQFGIWGLIPGALGAAAMFALAGLQEATIQSQHAPPFQPPAAPSYQVGAWDVPENQYALLHKKEMVVSAPFAEKFRESAGQTVVIPIQIGDTVIDTVIYDSLRRTAKRVGGRALNFKVA